MSELQDVIAEGLKLHRQLNPRCCGGRIGDLREGIHQDTRLQANRLGQPGERSPNNHQHQRVDDDYGRISRNRPRRQPTQVEDERFDRIGEKEPEQQQEEQLTQTVEQPYRDGEQ